MGNCDIAVLYPKASEHLGLFDDIKNMESVIAINTSIKYNVNFFVSAMRRIHLAKKVNAVIDLPFKYIWYDYNRILGEVDHLEAILIIDGALNDVDISFLYKCKARNNKIKFYLYLINSYKSSSPTFLNIKELISNKIWDCIYTFDPLDAKEQGFLFSGFNYYSFHDVEKRNIIYDCYFVGGLKGNRENLIVDIYSMLKRHSINSQFFVMTYKDQHNKLPNGIHSNDSGWIPYETILCDVSKSNCIIEILQENQSGPSLRYFEAICYNKKLLTNNPNIVMFPFYNVKFMRVFKSASDIDIDWIKRKEVIDYDYNNEFSPEHLIEQIREGKRNEII